MLLLAETETNTDGREPRADHDTEEVLNCVRAMEHWLDRLGETPVSLRLIKEIHRVREGIQAALERAHEMAGRYGRIGPRYDMPSGLRRRTFTGCSRTLSRIRSGPRRISGSTGYPYYEAATAFVERLAIVISVPERSQGETRYILLRESHRERTLVVVHTDLGESIRIISAREATRREKGEYERGD